MHHGNIGWQFHVPQDSAPVHRACDTNAFYAERRQTSFLATSGPKQPRYEPHGLQDLGCNATAGLRETHQWRRRRCCISTHLTFQVSQGSAATDLRWGENCNKFLFRNSLLNIVVKKYENPSIFARVIEKIKVSRFLWTTVYSVMHVVQNKDIHVIF